MIDINNILVKCDTLSSSSDVLKIFKKLGIDTGFYKGLSIGYYGTVWGKFVHKMYVSDGYLSKTTYSNFVNFYKENKTYTNSEYGKSGIDETISPPDNSNKSKLFKSSPFGEIDLSNILKEFKILKVSHKSTGSNFTTLKDNGLYSYDAIPNSVGSATLENLLSNEFVDLKIHSIKRLCDGEIFNIGDEIYLTSSTFGNIKEISLKDDKVIIHINRYFNNSGKFNGDSRIILSSGVSKLEKSKAKPHNDKDLKYNRNLVLLF